MKNVVFETEINASADKVWFVLWDKIQYGMWTAPFCEGSYVVTDWKEGSKVHFLSPSGEGMYSEVVENKPHKIMRIKHIGELKNKEEMPLDAASESWSGATENYYLTENNGKTKLTVKVDALENHSEFFNEAFPKALEIVKQLAEDFKIILEATIQAPLEKVWTAWTRPEHITQWNNASDDWHTTKAENDLQVGGRFTSRMEAKDGSFGFDFGGVYNEVTLHEQIVYTLDDGRSVQITFANNGNETVVTESFQAENTHSLELQREGWQAILHNFKKYVEANWQNY